MLFRFLQSFRLSKEAFIYVLNEIGNFLVDGGVKKIPLSVRLAATLNFYATGGYQRSIGDIMFHSMDQSVMSRTIQNLTEAMELLLCPKWIKFPGNDEKTANKLQFYEKTKFPGVIACVDCTHVCLIAPIYDEHLFVDRKGNHSLNVQLVICISNFPIKFHKVKFSHILDMQLRFKNSFRKCMLSRLIS